jgi:hypothetical protein
MSDFKLKRLGMIMEPRPDDPNEVEGVLNPAAVRGHDGQDGQLFLFPRLVARQLFPYWHRPCAVSLRRRRFTMPCHTMSLDEHSMRSCVGSVPTQI